MNEEQFNQLLHDALLEANRLDYQPVMEEPAPVAWSSHYQKQRRQLLRDPMRWYRKAIMPMWKRAGRAVASILLVLIVGLSAVLAVSPTARAAFFAWVQEIYETHIVYRFFGEPVEHTMPQYEITNLPTDYYEADRFINPGYVSVTYANDTGVVIYFDYIRMEEGGASVVVMDGLTRRETSVNGQEGYFYEAQGQGRSSALIWMDQAQNLQFTIDAIGDEETLLQYANNIINK